MGPQESPGPFPLQQISAHPWALEAPFAGKAARAVGGGGAGVVYTSAPSRLLPFVPAPPAQIHTVLLCPPGPGEGWREWASGHVGPCP